MTEMLLKLTVFSVVHKFQKVSPQSSLRRFHFFLKVKHLIHVIIPVRSGRKSVNKIDS